MKKKKWGRILSIGFILLSMLIVVLIAFNNPELMNAWDVLFTLDKRWLLLCLLAMVGYVYAEGAGLWFAMRSLLECLGSIYLTLLVIGGILFCNRRGLNTNKKLILGFGFFLVWCVLTVIFFAVYKALYLCGALLIGKATAQVGGCGCEVLTHSVER